MSRKEMMEVEEKVFETAKVPEKKKKVGVVNTLMLNVREKPIESGNVLLILTEGIEVEIDNSFMDQKWFKVTTAIGSVGYVIKDYISVK